MLSLSESTELASVAEDERDDYDELVSESPQGSIYCRRWWLDAVAPGRYEVLELRRGQELSAAWPLVFRRNSKAEVCRMPDLCQKLGVMFRPTDAAPAEQLSREHKLVEELISQLPDELSLIQNFHEHFTNWLPFYWHGFRQTTRYTYVLQDIANLDAVWSNMRAVCRRNIRKAEKQGLRTIEELPLGKFIDLQDAVFARQNCESPLSHELIERVDHACSERRCKGIFAAVDNQQRVHAAAYVVWDADTAYYIMGGSDPALRSSGAMRLVQWKAIQFASGVARRFDFEGSMIRDIESAFRSFGAAQMPYFTISRTPQVDHRSRFHPRRVAGDLSRWLKQRLVAA